MFKRSLKQQTAVGAPDASVALKVLAVPVKTESAKVSVFWVFRVPERSER